MCPVTGVELGSSAVTIKGPMLVIFVFGKQERKSSLTYVHRMD